MPTERRTQIPFTDDATPTVADATGEPAATESSAPPPTSRTGLHVFPVDHHDPPIPQERTGMTRDAMLARDLEEADAAANRLRAEVRERDRLREISNRRRAHDAAILDPATARLDARLNAARAKVEASPFGKLLTETATEIQAALGEYKQATERMHNPPDGSLRYRNHPLAVLHPLVALFFKGE